MTAVEKQNHGAKSQEWEPDDSVQAEELKRGKEVFPAR
jgi:hypothetical protein